MKERPATKEEDEAFAPYYPLGICPGNHRIKEIVDKSKEALERMKKDENNKIT